MFPFSLHFLEHIEIKYVREIFNDCHPINFIYEPPQILFFLLKLLSYWYTCCFNLRLMGAKYLIGGGKERGGRAGQNGRICW